MPTISNLKIREMQERDSSDKQLKQLRFMGVNQELTLRELWDSHSKSLQVMTQIARIQLGNDWVEEVRDLIFDFVSERISHPCLLGFCGFYDEYVEKFREWGEAEDDLAEISENLVRLHEEIRCLYLETHLHHIRDKKPDWHMRKVKRLLLLTMIAEKSYAMMSGDFFDGNLLDFEQSVTKYLCHTRDTFHHSKPLLKKVERDRNDLFRKHLTSGVFNEHS